MKILLAISVVLLALAGCHREGPAEKAGRSLDKAAKDLKDAVTPKK